MEDKTKSKIFNRRRYICLGKKESKATNWSSDFTINKIYKGVYRDYFGEEFVKPYYLLIEGNSGEIKLVDSDQFKWLSKL